MHLTYTLQKPWKSPAPVFLDSYLHPECVPVMTIQAADFQEAARKLSVLESSAGTAKPTTTIKESI